MLENIRKPRQQLLQEALELAAQIHWSFLNKLVSNIGTAGQWTQTHIRRIFFIPQKCKCTIEWRAGASQRGYNKIFSTNIFSN
jgi:hypothetical protein